MMSSVLKNFSEQEAILYFEFTIASTISTYTTDSTYLSTLCNEMTTFVQKEENKLKGFSCDDVQGRAALLVYFFGVENPMRISL